MKHTDYKQVLVLAQNILIEDKKMLQLTSNLNTQLKTLKASFQDDGIDEIEDTVKRLCSKLTSAQKAFMTIANELGEYAELLHKGKI